ACAFAPDGKTLLSGSRDQTLKLWEAASGKELRTLAGHKEAVWACAFAPDGKTLLSGSRDQTLKLWEAASGKELHTFDLGWIPRGIAFSPQQRGLVAVANANGTVTLFDLSREPRLAHYFAG
ncbi:MAG: hypothetical protein HY735_19155, partial [Verrucomicrobia bacterium]|nr:hypothetical protein [Verrucomicrobiota bacterium]